MNILQRIFTENIDKMINCGDPSFGGAMERRHEMDFLELYYNRRRVSLEEMYEKAMSKSRGKCSSA